MVVWCWANKLYPCSNNFSNAPLTKTDLWEHSLLQCVTRKAIPFWTLSCEFCISSMAFFLTVWSHNIKNGMVAMGRVGEMWIDCVWCLVKLLCEGPPKWSPLFFVCISQLQKEHGGHGTSVLVYLCLHAEQPKPCSPIWAMFAVIFSL